MSQKPLIAAILINTIFMIVLTLYLMKLPWLAGDEKFLIWSTSAVKFESRELPSSEDYALINTSYDLQLIDRYDEFGFPVGNQAITDRDKLAQLLRIINAGQNQPKYIICDIHFVDSTEFDHALHHELKASKKIILSSHLDDAGQVLPQLFDDINHGISDYVIGSIFDGVYKYQLIYNDSLKLLPLKVFEELSGATSKKAGPLVKINEHWTLNNFIMNYRVLQKDIGDLEAGFNPVNLGELLYLEDQDIQDFISGKVIVIGDFFEQDMHETIFEITAGPLILLNALLTISDGETSVGLLFFVLLAIVYGFLSYMAFSNGDIIEKRINRITSSKATKYLAGFSSYFLILSLLSVITFFSFNTHINVFFIAIAFYLIDQFMHLILRCKKVRKKN